MSTDAATGVKRAVVARLRAAGCVFAEDESELLIAAAATPNVLEDLIGRRVSGLPLEHILGWAAFCGLRIAVEPGVFVPRRRTEVLVEQAAILGRPRAVVVDLCCGSGALGVALLERIPGMDLHAVDLDPAAVRCARRNVGGRGQVYQGDLFAPLPAQLRGRIELLVVNAPYVPTEAIALLPPEARQYEPRLALDGGGDGLEILRRVIAGAPEWLAPSGHLIVETSRQQAAAGLEMMSRHGLQPRLVTDDEVGATAVIGLKHSDAQA